MILNNDICRVYTDFPKTGHIYGVENGLISHATRNRKMYSELVRYVIIHIIKMSVHFLIFVVSGHYLKTFN